MNVKENPKIQKLEKKIEELSRMDGWTNLLTGYGVQGKDKRVSGTYNPERRILQNEATSLYTGDGLAKRIVDVVIFDMLRNWFHIENDVDDLIQLELKKLKYKRYLKEALVWSDVYGGSIIFMGIDDGNEDPIEPLNEENIRKVEFLRVFDRWQMNVSSTDLYSDPAKNKFGEPEFYNIIPNSTAGSTEVQFTAHESRVLRFDGELVPDYKIQENEYWGISIYNSLFDRLRGLGMTYGNIELIIEEFVVGILKMDNLQALLQGGQTNLIRERLNLLDLSRHILNTYLIDNEEDFTRVSSTVTGLDQSLGKLESAVSGITGIPTALLFSESVKGMNASGVESEQTRRYYDKIKGRQEDKILEPSERLVYLIQKSKEGPTNGQVDPEIRVKFNPLWQPTMEQESETRKKISEADKNYWEMGVLTSDEIALARFGGEYTIDTNISEAHETEIDNREQIMAESTANGIFNGESEDNELDELDKEE